MPITKRTFRTHQNMDVNIITENGNCYLTTKFEEIKLDHDDIYNLIGILNKAKFEISKTEPNG